MQDFLTLDIDEQVKLVTQALTDGGVFDALESDGGGLEIMDIEKNEVMIRYFGACGGCHIAQGGTLNFIEQTLKSQVDPGIKVVIV